MPWYCNPLALGSQHSTIQQGLTSAPGFPTMGQPCAKGQNPLPGPGTSFLDIMLTGCGRSWGLAQDNWWCQDLCPPQTRVKGPPHLPQAANSRAFPVGPFAELDGLAHCRSTYQDWISLYCWTTFHATVMAMPDGSQCQWDQISRFELGVKAASSWNPHEVFWGVGAKCNHMARTVPKYHILRVQWKDLGEKGARGRDALCPEPKWLPFQYGWAQDAMLHAMWSMLGTVKHGAVQLVTCRPHATCEGLIFSLWGSP